MGWTDSITVKRDSQFPCNLNDLRLSHGSERLVWGGGGHSCDLYTSNLCCRFACKFRLFVSGLVCKNRSITWQFVWWQPARQLIRGKEESCVNNSQLQKARGLGCLSPHRNEAPPGSYHVIKECIHLVFLISWCTDCGATVAYVHVLSTKWDPVLKLWTRI